MNANDITNWDLARLRANASRERAQAFAEMRAQFWAWLRGTPRASPRECLGMGC
jgi:hypothetical protein